MARDTPRVLVAVDCESCGKGIGHKSHRGPRCGSCGQFAEPADDYCVEHDLDYSDIYPNDVHCPYCREEQAIRSQEMHRLTRDTQMEPW